jgi:hypothetical protein
LIDLKIDWMSGLIRQSLSQSFTSNCGSAYKLVYVVVCARYDSEYDNYRGGGGGGMTSDCESELNGGGEEGEGGEAHAQQENIRQISQNITNKFGTHRSPRSFL